MAVEDKNPQYINKEYEMRQMRDTVKGASFVKRSGSLYLPVPASMASNANSQPATGISNNSGEDINGSGINNIISDAPFTHGIPAYDAYVQRARFPDITALLLRGLVGIATKKEAKVNLPDDIDYLEDRCTRDGKDIWELFSWIVSEILTTGRVSLLLDVDDSNNKLVFVPYVAESLTNWKVTRDSITNNEILKLGVFEEQVSKSESDEFSHDTEPCYLVVRNSAVIENEPVEIYSTQKYIDGKPSGAATIPVLRGKPFPFPPVGVAGVNGLSFSFGPAPLLGVSDIAISIYQKDADLSQSEFMTCNPMLVVTGTDKDSTPKTVGSNVIWNFEDSEADAKFVEPTGSSLSHMDTRIQNLMKEAVQYGVSVLGGDTNSAEAADTVRMRQESNGSNLRTVIQSAESLINLMLEYAYNWENDTQDGFPESPKDETDFGFHANMELSEMSLSSQEQTALLQAFLNNAISHETYLDKMQKGGIKLAGENPEGEIDLIENQDPNLDE